MYKINEKKNKLVGRSTSSLQPTETKPIQNLHNHNSSITFHFNKTWAKQPPPDLQINNGGSDDGDNCSGWFSVRLDSNRNGVQALPRQRP